MLDPARTVFFFPVGGLEDHGAHLPLGLDLIEAQRLCALAAEKLEREISGWKGVIMPGAPLGVQSNTTELAITVRAHVLRDWLVDSCRSLERMGFAHFVCFSGQLTPRQLTAIEDAGKIVSRRARFFSWLRPFARSPSRRRTLVCALSARVSFGEVFRSPLLPRPSEHGGLRDTSVALAIDPALVDPAYRGLKAQESPCPRSVLALGLKRWNRKIFGSWGSPGAADATAGTRLMQESVDEVFPKLRAVWDGSNPDLIFRSWYSVIPPNKSFFKAWAIALAIFGLMLLWIYFSVLQSVVSS